jgi:hypothetical protein
VHHLITAKLIYGWANNTERTNKKLFDIQTRSKNLNTGTNNTKNVSTKIFLSFFSAPFHVHNIRTKRKKNRYYKKSSSDSHIHTQQELEAFLSQALSLSPWTQFISPQIKLSRENSRRFSFRLSHGK